MRVVVNARNRGFEFEASPDESLLMSGLKAGIALPYECATGTCGTCRATLLEGNINDPWPEAPGRKLLKEARDVLMCQCSPKSDCRVEVPGYAYHADASVRPPQQSRGVIRTAAMIAPDIVSFEIETDVAFNFDAGQFATIETAGVEGPRAYSMVNYERGAKRLEFVIKRKPDGGFSEWLFSAPDLRVGVEVNMVGPLGKAIFHPALSSNIVCIAGGSGIAGMMAILRRAMDEGYFKQFRGDIFFGVRRSADAFFLDQFNEAVEKFPNNLGVTIATSDEAPSTALRDKYPRLQFSEGFVHQVALQNIGSKAATAMTYLAGPPPLVDGALRALIVEAKVRPDRIRYDKFN